jgi:hypothetical protein
MVVLQLWCNLIKICQVLDTSFNTGKYLDWVEGLWRGNAQPPACLA